MKVEWSYCDKMSTRVQEAEPMYCDAGESTSTALHSPKEEEQNP